MAQSVTCLSYKHENLSSDPQNSPSMPGTAASSCTLSTGEKLQYMCEVYWPEHIRDFRFNKKSSQKIKLEMTEEDT